MLSARVFVSLGIAIQVLLVFALFSQMRDGVNEYTALRSRMMSTQLSRSVNELKKQTALLQNRVLEIKQAANDAQSYINDMQSDDKKQIRQIPEKGTLVDLQDDAVLSNALEKATFNQEGARELGFRAHDDTTADFEGFTVPIQPHSDTLDDDGSLQVFVIPHSHCDLGWLKTVEQYYQDDISKILSTLTVALNKKSDRRFAWVEVGFLERWWRDQSASTKETVKRLFKNGQIEWTMGGWVSNDEASVTFTQMINQMSLGHTWLQKEIGMNALPRVGWQIDPFGLSRVTPSLFSQMCFDANVAWRISEPEMQEYMVDARQELEFVWRGQESLGESSQLLMHLLPWGYEAPGEFLFEQAGPYQRVLKQPSMVASAAEALARVFLSRSKHYRTNKLMFPWGHDFRFKDANLMFDSMDLLIDYINSHRNSFKMRVQYATPSEYFAELQQHDHNTWPVKTKDFFPYWAGPVNFWSGYYTSRPALKRRSRRTDSLQRSGDILYVMARAKGFTEDLSSDIYDMRAVQGIMQHHDAITGTMRENVLTDYHTMLDRVTEKYESMVPKCLSVLLSNSVAKRPVLEHSFPNTWEQGIEQTVVIFNPLAWNYDGVVEIEVKKKMTYRVTDAKGNVVASQLVPTWDATSLTPTPSKWRLIVEAKLLPLAIQTLFVKALENNARKSVDIWTSESETSLSNSLEAYATVKAYATNQEVFVENDMIRIAFDSNTGNLAGIVDKATGKFSTLSTSYWEYAGDRAWSNHYTFKAMGPASSMEGKGLPTFLTLHGELCSEMHRKISPLIYQRTRICRGSASIEIEHSVGPPNRGTDMIVRFATDLVTNGKFVTDDNGLDRVPRVFNDTQMISGNYYPMVYSSSIAHDTTAQQVTNAAFEELHVISDTAEGVTSPQQGVLEVMLTRNTLQSLGNGEVMNDRDRVSLRHVLLWRQEDIDQRFKTAMIHNNPLTIAMNPTSRTTWTSQYGVAMQPMANAMPDDIYLMSLEARLFAEGERQNVVLRLLNHRDSGTPQQVNLKRIFNPSAFTMGEYEERTLSLTRRAEQCVRYHWHPEKEQTHDPRSERTVARPSSSIDNGSTRIGPMEFRTFLLYFLRNN